MSKADRLEYLRARAKQRVPLSAVAAETLEVIKAEDPDLGGECFGESLAPDSVRLQEDPTKTEDESERNTELISPWMREEDRQAEKEIAHAEV